MIIYFYFKYFIRDYKYSKDFKCLGIDSYVPLYTLGGAELFNERSNLDNLLCLLAYSATYKKK